MKSSLWACVLALGLSLAACGPRGAAPVTAFEGRLADWTREILADSPETATLAGVSEAEAGGAYAGRLDDRSIVAVEARRSAAVRRLAELRALATDNLDPEDAFTLAVLRAQFEASAAAATFDYGRFSPFAGLQPYVLNQLDSAFITLPAFLDERHVVENDADAESYITRLHQVAVAVDAETARARLDAEHGVRPPIAIMDATLRALDVVIATRSTDQIYFTSFARKLAALAAAEQDEAARATLEERHRTYLGRAEAIIRTEIIPAHQRAAFFVRADRFNASDEASIAARPRGAEFYAAALRLETTTDLTPAQIHALGRERVAVLTSQLDIALRRVGLTEGAVGARMRQLTADPRYAYPNTEEGRSALMSDVRARVDRVMQRANQWFGRLPRARLEVRPVPDFAQAGAPGAYYSPPSLDGLSPGVYYVNLRDLSEITRIDLPTQDYHEAVPGHHFQIALAQEQGGLPLLRRLISFNAYGEGWALYAEELADEQGFYDGDPIGRIGYLRWQLWRAARLVVDTGLHAQNWSRQQAIDYLLETTGDTPGVIASEVDRYIVWPGQACGYEIGRREIARLREDARNQLGPDFDLRGFHDTVLLNGETPLNVLGEAVRRWIPEQRRLADRERRRR
ncbi:MAG: DUF885 domain-containing protein [Hyphomonadaceae bacterium]|nr:DUF885 domain-containing protein [Hyphomonadaceae bacterium]